MPYVEEHLGAVMGDLMGRPFDLVLGRKNYDIFAAFCTGSSTRGSC